MAVAAAFSHTAAVSQDGSLFVWGSGGQMQRRDPVHDDITHTRGQLGTGDTNPRLDPTRVIGLPAPVRQVAAGWRHTGIVTDAGDLLMCGRGTEGRLGLGDEDDRATPTLVARVLFDGEAVLMVACGQDHTAVVTEGGGVYTFGKGGQGRLGHGNEENQLAPRRVPAAAFNGERGVMVAVGYAHTVALSEAGHVFTWGWGVSGQLGHNDTEDQWAPRQVEAGWFGGEKVVFVAAGRRHTVAVTARGQLYTWGDGQCGQLGHDGVEGLLLAPWLVVGQDEDDEAFEGSAVVMAACGGEHTLVLTCDGALWACGCGSDGQLGLFDVDALGPLHPDGPGEDGFSRRNDEDDRDEFVRVDTEAFGDLKVVAAAAGDSYSAAVTEDGALWTWGLGSFGQLGHGYEERRILPTQVARAGFGGERIGRCRPLLSEHALAFSMGTHGRLGGGEQGAAAGEARRSSRLQEKAASPIFGLKEELVGMIVRLSVAWPAGGAGEEEGVMRLLGGGGEVGRAMRAWPTMAMQVVAAREEERAARSQAGRSAGPLQSLVRVQALQVHRSARVTRTRVLIRRAGWGEGSR